MHLAFQKLRNHLLPSGTIFRIPGPRWVGTLLSCNCLLILGSAILLFFWIPGEPLDLVFALQVSISILLTLGIGEWLVRQGERRRAEDQRQDQARNQHLSPLPRNASASSR